MHTTQQLREYADTLERANVHEDMGLALSLSQAADLLRWAAAEVAARDHLRARLRQLQEYARHKKGCDSLPMWSPVRLKMEYGTCNCGLADLLAVLTEQLQEKKDDTTDTRAERSPS